MCANDQGEREKHVINVAFIRLVTRTHTYLCERCNQGAIWFAQNENGEIKKHDLHQGMPYGKGGRGEGGYILYDIFEG